MNTTYAGFWLRFVAYIIDAIILYIIYAFVLTPLFAVFGLTFFSQMGNVETMTEAEAVGAVASIMGAMMSVVIVLTGISIAYFSIMEASKYQATVGKMAIGLVVTDVNGNRLSIGKAIVRNLCRILSGSFMAIGYIIAGFTEKKQALHDLIAGTLVVKKASATAQV